MIKSTKKIAVVVINYNGKNLLKKFLPFVVKYSDDKISDIFLIDNNSSDGSVDFIKKKSGMNPIVLLDDIVDKLDQDRVSQTIQLFDNENLGQVFISDTHEDRIKTALEMTTSDHEIFNLC